MAAYEIRYPDVAPNRFDSEAEAVRYAIENDETKTPLYFVRTGEEIGILADIAIDLGWLQCSECDRWFDMTTRDADEWYYGHDCEV